MNEFNDFRLLPASYSLSWCCIGRFLRLFGNYERTFNWRSLYSGVKLYNISLQTQEKIAEIFHDRFSPWSVAAWDKKLAKNQTHQQVSPEVAAFISIIFQIKFIGKIIKLISVCFRDYPLTITQNYVLELAHNTLNN